MGGGSDFKGKGEASQSNQLAGEISVTIAEVYPNGTMLVRGEKLLTLNRGDERVQITGLVRAIEIGPDYRIAPPHVAAAPLRNVGTGDTARHSSQSGVTKTGKRARRKGG